MRAKKALQPGVEQPRVSRPKAPPSRSARVITNWTQPIRGGRIVPLTV